jgi:hypothetical protein
MTKLKHMLIFEGPDCGGKSTLMRELNVRLGMPHEVHSGPFPRITNKHLPRLYLESMFPLLMGYDNLAMDRSWLSEPIYGAAFRKGEDRVGTINRRHLERIAMRHGAVVVLCMPPWERVKEQWLARKGADSDAEYLDRIEQLESVYDMYDKTLPLVTDLPIVRYDYTKHGKAQQQLLAEIVRVAMPLHRLATNTVGNLNAPVILIGDKPSGHTDNDTVLQYPFCSFSGTGTSRWLTAELIKAEIPERSLLWGNADDGVWWLRDHYDRTVFAMGDNAAKTLENAGIPHVQVDHPQYHRRFKSSEPYPLIDLIKAAAFTVTK